MFFSVSFDMVEVSVKLNFFEICFDVLIEIFCRFWINIIIISILIMLL